MLNKIASGICAGILISIGGSVFLSCENKIVGALLFTVALLCICYKGYSLFTGKVGYLPEKADKEAVSVLLLLPSVRLPKRCAAVSSKRRRFGKPLSAQSSAAF